jgi:hypothetical protein
MNSHLKEAKANQVCRGPVEGKDFYKGIEPSIRGVVKTLRNAGFNTFCSCGHLPRPYVQMEWVGGYAIERVVEVLKEQRYDRFTVQGYVNIQEGRENKLLEVTFYPKLPLAMVRQLKLQGKDKR